jgi:hypothetical protein
MEATRDLMPDEASELPARLLEDAAGNDVFQLRRDAVRAARALQLASPPEAPLRSSRPLVEMSIATAVGLLAGLFIAYLLARTVWAPPIHCQSFANGTFACSRAN